MDGDSTVRAVQEYCARSWSSASGHVAARAERDWPSELRPRKPVAEHKLYALASAASRRGSRTCSTTSSTATSAAGTELVERSKRRRRATARAASAAAVPRAARAACSLLPGDLRRLTVDGRVPPRRSAPRRRRARARSRSGPRAVELPRHVSYDSSVNELLSRRLKDISPKAYEHPADRAATAALQSIPGLDLAIRGLVEMRYERAYRQTLHGERRARRAETQLPRVWAQWQAAIETLDLADGFDVYVRQAPTLNAAAIGASKPMVVVNSADDHAARRAGAADGARARGGPHPLRARALPDRARDAAAALAARSGCRCSAACRCWRCGRSCSSGSAPPSSRPTAPRRSSTAIRSSPRAR